MRSGRASWPSPGSGTSTSASSKSSGVGAPTRPGGEADLAGTRRHGGIRTPVDAPRYGTLHGTLLPSAAASVCRTSLRPDPSSRPRGRTSVTVAEGSSMRRIRILIVAAAACVAAFAVVSNARCRGLRRRERAPATTRRSAPTATVGQSYSRRVHRSRSRGMRARRSRSAREGFLPGFRSLPTRVSREELRHSPGATPSTSRWAYTCGTGGKGPGVFSDQQFTINVNRAAPRLVVVDAEPSRREPQPGVRGSRSLGLG